MTHLFVDTNIYIGFYQSAKDRLTLFTELLKIGDGLILTQQSFDEFTRNRVTRLDSVAEAIKASTESRVLTTSIVRELPQYQEIVRLQTKIRELSGEISEILYSWRDKKVPDPVLQAYGDLLEASTYLETTPELIKRAQTRKLLGQPPFSPDKHTIGDELIWETLLENCTNDLIIVSRDGTFLKNKLYLSVQYGMKNPGRSLTITDSPTEALKLFGIQSKRLAEAEAQVAIEVEAIHSRICQGCGGRLEFLGVEGSGGGEAHWYQCVKCGVDVFP